MGWMVEVNRGKNRVKRQFVNHCVFIGESTKETGFSVSYTRTVSTHLSFLRL